MGHRLEVADGPAEGLSFRRVGGGGLDGPLGHPHGEGAHAGAKQVQGAHGHPEPPIDLSQDLVRPHRHAIQLQPPDGVIGKQVQRGAGQSRAVAGHDERGDTQCLHVSGGPGEQHVHVGVRRVRDPRLGPRQAKPVSISFGPKLQGRSIRTVLRLGEGEGGNGFAARYGRDPPADLLFVPRQDDGAPPQALHGQGRLRLRGLGGQALPKQAEVRGRHRVATLGSGEQPTQQPGLPQGPNERPVDPSRLPLRDDGGQPFAGELPGLLSQAPLLVGQVEGHPAAVYHAGFGTR
jgi:hypothetical protein